MSNFFVATNAAKFVDESTCLTEQIEEWNRMHSIVAIVKTFPAGGGTAS